MHFPFYIHVLGYRIPPHPFFECIAYALAIGMHIAIRCRRGEFSRPTPQLQTLWIMLGCLGGALVGARLLACLQWLPLVWAHRSDPWVWVSGKTIVGGLAGGWLGVELAKKLLGVRHSVGNTMVFPVMLGMAIGRVGCFLTGLSDGTCGKRTSLPWGVNFGDGVNRHPTQLYDIAFLLVFGCVLFFLRRKLARDGAMFRVFVLIYMLYRFGVDFLKPSPWMIGGITPIQMACLGMGVVCVAELVRIYAPRRSVAELPRASAPRRAPAKAM